MPSGLRRYQQTKQLHFITFSCYRRKPKLGRRVAHPIFRRHAFPTETGCPVITLLGREALKASLNSGSYSHLLPPSRGPLGLDLDPALHAGQVVPVAGPLPVLRPRHQATSHGVAVNVTQFFNALPVAPYVEVLVTRLPEGLRAPQRKPASHRLFQGLNRNGKLSFFRLTHQQMHVLRHHDIP